MKVLELIDYLQGVLESASRIPMTGKAMINVDEFQDMLEEIKNYLPEELRKAQWIVQEKQRMINEAKEEIESMKKESMEYYRDKIRSHDFVKEAKVRAEKIVSSAELNAKTIKNGTKEYAEDVLTRTRKDIEEAKKEILKSIQITVEHSMIELDNNLNKVVRQIQENQEEIKNM